VQLFIDETPGAERRPSCAPARAAWRAVRRHAGPDRHRLPAADERQASSGENRATEIGEISRGLKALAKELQCPVIALSQLNRSVEKPATTSAR
jgi:replicative DNA helicase